MGHALFCDDNFHYMDESDRIQLGEYDSAEEALAAARAIVEADLAELHRAGMTADEWFSHYTHFGRDPYIVTDDPDLKFSAWDYARERCRGGDGEITPRH